MRKRAVFLDRDGTLNQDPGYLSDPDRLALLPKVAPALKALQDADYLLIVISNQSGIGRGLIQPHQLELVQNRLRELLAKEGVSLDLFRHCPHHPEVGCECRKPKPKLIIDTARELSIDVASSYMVGDKLTDLEAGQSAGCSGVALVLTGDGAETKERLRPGAADFVGGSLLEVAQWILSRS